MVKISYWWRRTAIFVRLSCKFTDAPLHLYDYRVNLPVNRYCAKNNEAPVNWRYESPLSTYCHRVNLSVHRLFSADQSNQVLNITIDLIGLLNSTLDLIGLLHLNSDNKTELSL